jgi:phosphoribosylaminoimidazolecarboxamide formyltransferase/IMP cyclohydrolase
MAGRQGFEPRYSVTDKTGVVEFARSLASLGVEILSTGGTYRALTEAGIAPLREVADVTQFPEMLDGRVKTIHPRIAGGILAMRQARTHASIARARHSTHRSGVRESVRIRENRRQKPDATLEELIENIDIGGPTMIRAAAKNWQDVAVVTSPADYAAIVEELQTGGGFPRPETHWRLAKKAFSTTTAAYDRAVSARLAEIPPTGRAASGHARHSRAAQTGAALRRESASIGGSLRQWSRPASPEPRNCMGKELSYNNLVDLDAAWQLIASSTPRLRPSSSTPIPAAARKERLSPKATAGRSRPIRSRRTAACWRSTARWIPNRGRNRQDFHRSHRGAGLYAEDALQILKEKKNLRLLRVAADLRNWS